MQRYIQYIWYIIVKKPEYTVASVPAVTGSVLMRKCRLFFGTVYLPGSSLGEGLDNEGGGLLLFVVESGAEGLSHTAPVTKNFNEKIKRQTG